jgi:hypothetical protein
VIAALRDKLDRDRYPRASRLDAMRSARAKLDPSSVPRPVRPRVPPPSAVGTRGIRSRR